MERQIVATKGDRAWQGIPAIECAGNGRLWCAFFSGGPKEPDPANAVFVSTRRAVGAGWSEPTMIVSPPGATRAYDPCLWHDPDGRLWLFYNHANIETRQFSVWAITTDSAHTAAPVWSAPRSIDLRVPFAFRLNKPTVLTTGEWLLPVTWSRNAPDGWFAGTQQLQGVAVSTDHGATWELRGAVEAPHWALENMVVERADGSVWMLIRSGAGVLWESVSVDRGRTWSAGAPTRIVNPGSRFIIRRLASGRLLLINTPDAKHRRGLVAYLSGPGDDNIGAACGLELDARDKVSYPDAVQATDGRIFAVHDCDRYGPGEVVLNVFTEAEILAAAEAAGG